MNIPNRFLVNVLFFASLIAFLSVPAQAAEDKKRTVYDYYMLLPNDYFNIPLASRKNLLDKNAGGIVDEKNGYLYAQGKGSQPSLEVAVFKRKSQEDIVAVCHNETKECVGFMYFYERRPRYQGVVRCPNLLPTKFDAKYNYKLPRNGKTITVTDSAGKVVHTYSWTGSKFQ